MHDRVESIPFDDAEPIDLAAFGFDEGDAWLERFRHARAAEPLGRMGDYEILAEVGRGGQGIVYQARRAHDGMLVAIKRLLGGRFASADLRSRFEREMRAISALNHPNIARAIDVEVLDGQPAIVLQWIDGRPLTEFVRSSSFESTPQAVAALFVHVCDAVHHAHLCGIIHRDLKPSNVLVTHEANGTPQPVVLDFGMARILETPEGGEPSVTATGHFIGTLAYAAPEQISEGRCAADGLADVYALGVMLFEALTGSRPYSVDGPLAESIRSIREKRPERPSRRAAGISRDLDAIVLKALEKSPRDRYQSVDAFASDLRRYLDGDPVDARAPGSLYLAGKLIRRHPFAFAAGVAIFAVITGLTTALLLSRQNERDALRVAETTSAFLADTFAAARPSQSGADVTLLEVLAQAGERAQRELAGSPRAAADVHLAIGTTYNTLWQWRDAIRHLENAVSLYRDTNDRESADLATALTALGRAYTSTRDGRAVDTQREALAMRRALFREPDARIAECLKELAYALQQAADPPRWDEAERSYEQALAMFRATLGDDDRETAGCLHSFGWMRVRQKRIVEAVDLYSQALDALRRTNQQDDPFYVECLYGYAAQLAKLGRDEERLAALNELIPLLRSSHGQSAADEQLWMKADAEVTLRRFDDASETFSAAFESFVRYRGLEPVAAPITLSTDSSAAALQRADALCNQLLTESEEFEKLDLIESLTAIQQYVRYYIATERFDRVDELLDAMESTLDRDALAAPIIRSTILERRAEISTARGDDESAERFLRHAISIVEDGGSPFPARATILQAPLARCLERLGRTDAALVTMRDSLAGLEAHLGREHRYTRSAKEWLRDHDSVPDE